MDVSHSAGRDASQPKIMKTAPIGIVERLALGNLGDPDEAVGVGNMHGCLALVASMADGEAKAQLFKFLGVQAFHELQALKNPDRFMFAIVSAKADTVLQAKGQTCLQKISQLGGLVVPMPTDMTIEDALNKILEKPLQLTEPLFKPKVIHDPSGDELLLCMVAAESIKISWMETFDNVQPGTFTTLAGAAISAMFCGDHAPSQLLYLQGGDVFHAVSLPAKPEKGTARSMILFLPTNGHTLEDAGAKLGEMYARGEVRWASRKVNLTWPRFNVVSGPNDLKGRVAPTIPNIFDPGAHPFEGTFPSADIDGDAYVAKIIHFASISADEHGAEAKAVTVAPVCVYRSMSAPDPPVLFRCDVPFGVVLVDGDVVSHNISVEFTAKIADKGVVRA